MWINVCAHDAQHWIDILSRFLPTSGFTTALTTDEWMNEWIISVILWPWDILFQQILSSMGIQNRPFHIIFINWHLLFISLKWPFKLGLSCMQKSWCMNRKTCLAFIVQDLLPSLACLVQLWWDYKSGSLWLALVVSKYNKDTNMSLITLNLLLIMFSVSLGSTHESKCNKCYHTSGLLCFAFWPRNRCMIHHASTESLCRKGFDSSES